MQTDTMTARSRRRAVRRFLWRRILVPIDFSKTSLRAMDVAVPAACQQGGELVLLSVVEPNAYAAGMEGVIITMPDDALADAAKAKLARIAERFIPSSVTVKTLVKRGRPFEVIAQIAGEMDVDLIVLTTHGRTGLDRVLMGSTAERVVRHAHCPVYVVRSIWRHSTRRQKED